METTNNLTRSVFYKTVHKQTTLLNQFIFKYHENNNLSQTRYNVFLHETLCLNIYVNSHFFGDFSFLTVTIYSYLKYTKINSMSSYHVVILLLNLKL